MNVASRSLLSGSAYSSILARRCRQTHRMLTLRGPAGRLRDAVLRRIPGALATRALAVQLGLTAQPVLH